MCRAEKCNLRHRIPSRESLVICICLFKDQRPYYLTLAVDVHKYVQVLNTHTVIRTLDIASVYVATQYSILLEGCGPPKHVYPILYLLLAC